MRMIATTPEQSVRLAARWRAVVQLLGADAPLEAVLHDGRVLHHDPAAPSAPTVSGLIVAIREHLAEP